MITLKNVRINKYYEYFFCPCTLTMDLIDEIRRLDPTMKFYDYDDINRHKTGIKYLDGMTVAEKQDVSEFFVMAGMTEEEACPDSLDAIYTRLDSFDLCEASKQLFGETMDPDYKESLSNSERLESQIAYKLQMRKAV